MPMQSSSVDKTLVGYNDVVMSEGKADVGDKHEPMNGIWYRGGPHRKVSSKSGILTVDRISQNLYQHARWIRPLQRPRCRFA